MKSEKGTALITGASSGIGAIYADRLAKRGYDLILVARSHDRLGILARRIEECTGRRVETITADLNDSTDLRRVESVLLDDLTITMLFNIAGVASIDPLLKSDVGKMEDMIALNIGAPTRLSYAAAPGFVKRGEGTIINISSIVGIAPESLNGVYGSTKAYVLAFSQSLYKELSGKGVRVQVVLPGATATDIWEKTGSSLDSLSPDTLMQGGDMVDAALTGLDQGEFVTIPSLPDAADWHAYEADRQKLMPNLSRDRPAERYRQAMLT